jgi:hypothetical protein
MKGERHRLSSAQTHAVLVKGYRNGTRAFVYFLTEMESELLFIVLQKWDQSFCVLSLNKSSDSISGNQ